MISVRNLAKDGLQNVPTALSLIDGALNKVLAQTNTFGVRNEEIKIIQLEITLMHL